MDTSSRGSSDDTRIRNPAFERTVRESFARQGLMQTCGARLLRVEPGLVEIGYGADPALSQQHGFMHAGIATAIVDTACGYAALTLAEPGNEVLTAEFKINFLRPAAQPRFIARGRVIRSGRLLSVVEGEVLGLADEKSEPVAIARMQATMTLLRADGIANRSGTQDEE